MIRVESEGPKKCILALIGEAPGEMEELETVSHNKSKPFCGPSGHLLNTKLHLCGISRHQCYVTNLSKVRPPKNDFSTLYWSKKAPTGQLLTIRDELLQELDTIDTNIFVALGANALWALTGKTEISKWRGSILECKLPSGRKVKVIGTFHPAAVLRQWEIGAVLQFDLTKALEQSKSPIFTPLERTIQIAPTLKDVSDYLEHTVGKEEISFDIETVPGGITCIAFATNPTYGISIPTTIEYWGDSTKLKLVLEMINLILSDLQSLKIGQNITYDIQYLARFFGILPTKPWCDTMIMQHSCYSELKKGLAFLTSVYTNEPYYKDDLKVWLTGTVDIEELWKYNCKDALVTIEVKHELDKEMDSLGVREAYNFKMSLMEPLLYMMLRGLKVDRKAIKHHIDIYIPQMESKMQELNKKYGDFNPNSPKQVKALLERLGFKNIPDTKKKTLDKLSAKSPELAKISAIREERTQLSNFLDIRLDPIDSRLRYSLNATGTETSRLSSSASVFGSGRNLQNFPKKLRDMIIPDEGMMFSEIDLEGAESRVVAYLSEDPIAIRVFEEGKNIHTLTACMIWNLTPEQVAEDKIKKGEMGLDTQSKYFMAKKLRHSLEKMGSWVTVSEQLKISAKDAKSLVERFHKNNPNLSRWFRSIEAQLKKNRTIITPLGEKRIFFGRMGSQMVKDAAAHIPQAVVARVINTGIVNIYNTLCKEHKDIEVLLQVHDSMLLQHKPESLDIIKSEISKLCKIEIPCKGGFFVIPVGIKSGINWRELA